MGSDSPVRWSDDDEIEGSEDTIEPKPQPNPQPNPQPRPPLIATEAIVILCVTVLLLALIAGGIVIAVLVMAPDQFVEVSRNICVTVVGVAGVALGGLMWWKMME